MDQELLVTFERIAREGNFSRAARSLDLSQATISGRIAALEEMVGGPLFARGARRATLTPSGEAFLPYARRALAILAEGTEAAREARVGRHGRVALGVLASITDDFLAPIVARFRRDYPQVALSIRTGHTHQIVQDLADGIVRLGLVTWRYTGATVDLETLVRFREPLLAVVAPAHPLAARGPVTIDEVVRQGDPLHETVWGSSEDARLARETRPGRGEVELPAGVMRRLILDGLGAGFLPLNVVRADIAAGLLVSLPLCDADGLARELALVCHAPADPLPPAARALAEAIRAEAARAFEPYPRPMPPDSHV